MPKVSFVKKQLQTLEVPAGAELMDSLNNAGIPVASSCGGEGVCTKCLVRIIEGNHNLSRESDLEQDMRDIHEFPKGTRMSCQAQVHGDITIDTDYW